MARLSIASLRSKWGSALKALIKIKEHANPGPFKDNLNTLVKDLALEKSLDNYIILEKDSFPAPKLVGLLRDLGVTPERIKETALADGLVNARVLEGELLIEPDTTISDDNMVQLMKVLLYKDYEGAQE